MPPPEPEPMPPPLPVPFDGADGTEAMGFPMLGMLEASLI